MSDFNIKNAKIRIAVTGSRGKSTVVRMLHRALVSCGLECRTRLTGVVPRELSNTGAHIIARHAGAHVEELNWWLSQLPQSTEAVVSENSAVSPHLQHVCPMYLMPHVTILTNTRLDHEELWGHSEESVFNSLFGALPENGKVVLPDDIAQRYYVKALAEEKNLILIPALPLENLTMPSAINASLAIKALSLFGLDAEKCLDAVLSLPPDIADSQVIKVGNGSLAFAFSVNDVQSTEEYFASLGVSESETCVIYNHRSDRSDRLGAFKPFLLRNWRSLAIIGDKPPFGGMRQYYKNFKEPEELALFISQEGFCFGCGNTVSGLPLILKLSLEEGLIF